MRSLRTYHGCSVLEEIVPVRRFAHLLSLTLLASCLSAVAADWPSIPSEDKKLDSVPGQPGAPAITLLREEVDSDLQHYHSVYTRIKILTEAGKKYGDVELPFSGAGLNLGEVRGRTVQPDGSIVAFEGKPFDKVIVAARGRRYHVNAFTLPAVQVGSILDFKYTLRYPDNRVVAPRWIVQSELYQKKASFKFYPSQFDIQLGDGTGRVGHGVNWTSFVPNVQPKEHVGPGGYAGNPTSRGGAGPAADFIELNLTQIPPVLDEPFSPPGDSLKWRVYFYYRFSRPEDYWKDEGNVWNKDVEKFLGRKNGVAEAVAKSVRPADTPEQKLKAIYGFVSGLENREYVPAREDQEAHALGLKPNKGADDVLGQKSGSHDDLNRLLVAMARAAGFQASMMRLPHRDKFVYDPSYLSIEQFAGEVAVVQLSGKDVYLDPGSKYCPYGLLDWRYSGTKGLRQSAATGTEIGETPVSTYAQAMVTKGARLTLNDHGSAEGILSVSFLGLEGMRIRQELGRTDEAGRKKFLEEEMKNWLPGGSEVTLSKLPPWEDAEAPLTVDCKVSFPLATSAGKRWVLPAQALRVNEKPLFSVSGRSNPLYFYYPLREVDEIHLILPPDTQIESLPSNATERLPYAVYDAKFARESTNGIFVRRDLVMNGIAFPATSYKDIKGFFDKAKTGDDQQILLKASPHAEGS